MKPIHRALLLASFALLPSFANAAPACERLFSGSVAPKATAPRINQSDRVARVVALIEAQASVVRSALPFVDQVAANNYLNYLEAYKARTASMLDVMALEETRLEAQLNQMRAAADDLAATPYPKEELSEKIKERKTMAMSLVKIEKLWNSQDRIERERHAAQAIKQNNPNDGKAIAGAVRALDSLAKESSSVQQALSAVLQRVFLSEYEKLLIQAFFSDRSMPKIYSFISHGDTVHLSQETLAELSLSPDKATGFATYFSHLKERHEERLQREISTMLETYSAVAHSSHEKLFPWDRHSHRFQRHSDILDLELRERLVTTEEQLEAKTGNLASDRQTLSDLWAKRNRLKGMIEAVETHLSSTSKNLINASVRGTIVTQLGELYKKLQATEDAISSLYSLWGPKERARLALDPGLTEAHLLAELEANIKSLRSRLEQLLKERAAWIERHRSQGQDDSDDGIEIFYDNIEPSNDDIELF